MVVGLSSHPTRYRLTIHGLPVYVRCGADLLLTAHREDLDAEARCPICGNPISFRVRNRALKELRPANSLLHLVETWNGSGATVECDGTHLFDARECLEGWRRDNPGWRGRVLGLQEYMDLCATRREVARHLSSRQGIAAAAGRPANSAV